MSRWFCMSDIHGSVYEVLNFIERNKDLEFTSDDKMLLLGDTGANYYCNSKDVTLKRQLSATPFTYYLVRGNHEQRPSILMNEHPDNWRLMYDEAVGGEVIVERSFPNIRYFKDEPAVYNIDGYKTLVMGGAYSVDKYHRLHNGWNWYDEEQLSDEEMEDARNLCEENSNTFDLVLTHTCPTSFEPTDLFIPNLDQSMVDKTMERFFGELEYKLDYKAWMWGHFHAHRPYPLRDGKKQMMLYVYDVIELHDFMDSDDYPTRL